MVTIMVQDFLILLEYLENSMMFFLLALACVISNFKTSPHKNYMAEGNSGHINRSQ